jgi:hypothetical protein
VHLPAARRLLHPTRDPARFRPVLQARIKKKEEDPGQSCFGAGEGVLKISSLARFRKDACS